MMFVFRWVLVFMIVALLSWPIFVRSIQTSPEAELGFEYPVGSFEVHMFIEQYKHQM